METSDGERPEFIDDPFSDAGVGVKHVRASVQVFNFLPTYPRLRDRAYERSVCIHVGLSMCTCVGLSVRM